MKNFIFIFFCLFAIFSLISCNTTSTTEVSIRNTSSYDLRLVFIPDSIFENRDIKDFVLIKKTITHFRVELPSSTAWDPNCEIKEMVFLNLEDSLLIKRLKNDNLFIETGRKEYHGWGSDTVFYNLIITDVLLQ